MSTIQSLPVRIAVIDGAVRCGAPQPAGAVAGWRVSVRLGLGAARTPSDGDIETAAATQISRKTRRQQRTGTPGRRKAMRSISRSAPATSTRRRQLQCPNRLDGEQAQ